MIAALQASWPTTVKKSTANYLNRLLDAGKKPRTLSLTEWAEKEFIVPEGKFSGYRFRYRRQPWALLLHREIEKDYWRKIAATGCVQSGKTLHTIVMPLLHDMFERKLDIVGYGVPTMDMAFDKYTKEIFPSIMGNGQFRGLLPTRGKGSRGGRFESIKFDHGPEIKFASAGGDDAKRSGWTCPKIYVTEADKLDEASETSREGAPIDQFEARTNSFGDQARMHLECTASIPEGRIWIEIKAGSDGRICCRCPHCKTYVTPEFEDLKGYQGAENELEAESKAYFACPSCDHEITPEERIEMNRTDDACKYPAVLAHRGQKVDKRGRVVGPLPPTYTLGFRWNAFNNMFWTPGWLGIQEWRADQDPDNEDVQKVRWQFRWGKPYVPKDIDYIDIKPADVQRRQTVTGKGTKPKDTYATTIGADVGKWKIHWTATAWTPNGGVIFDYGEKGVRSDKYGIKKAITIALSELHESLGSGWSDDKYDAAGIDIKYKPAEVVAAIKALKDKRWRACRGLGDGQYKKKTFNGKTTSSRIRWASDHGYDEYDRKYKAWVMSADSNHWKTWLHERLVLNTDEDEADMPIVLYASTNPKEHYYFSRHVTAEKESTVFEKGKKKVVWEQLRDANHWLDSTYLSCFMRERLKRPTAAKSAAVPTEEQIQKAMQRAKA